MTCDELQPDYLLYALGTMGAEESSHLREHLDRGCAACTEGLRQAHAVAYSMGAALDGPDAPRALRGRVLAISGQKDRPVQVRPVARWRGWALAAAAAILLLVPGLFWYRELTLARARQAATASLLAEERRTSASLRDASPGAVPIFALELERGEPAETVKQLAVPRGVKAVVLALPADLVRQASAAELRNASGQAIWAASPMPATDADSTGLTVPGQLLSPGRYVVVLLAGDRTLARLPVQVILR